MTIILTGIRSLTDHPRTLHAHPEDYRPKQCPVCSNRIVWCHGCYPRKADRQDLGVTCLNPIPIPRFFCPSCSATCSVLPEAVPPRRWHLWSVQQAVLLLLLAGGSCYHASSTRGNRPCRQTIRHWWQRLREEFVLHAFTLRQRFPCLGRSAAFVEFWTAALVLQPLSALMALLHQEGTFVP